MVDALSNGVSFLPLQFSRNIIDYTIPAADLNLTDRSDLRYLLEIKKPSYFGSSTYESLRILEGREKPPYTTQGTLIYEGARFPFNRGRGGILDSLLEYTKPIRNQQNIRAILSQVLPYQLTAQVLGGTPVQNTTAITPPFYAIKAGLATEDFAVHSDTFWTDFQATNRKFLTWLPDNQRVAKGQEEYLHFVMNFTPLPSEIRLRVQFRNYGSEATAADTVMSITNVPLYSVICVPVGPDIVGMDTDYDYYDVWLSDQDNARISEVRSYQLDKTFEAFDRGILFANSMGGWDTLRCTGRAVQTMNVNQAAAQREKIKKNDVEYSDLLLINTEGNRSITVSTGYFRRDAEEHLLWLGDLLLSEECYWMTDKGHRPVQIATNTLVDAEDESDMVARVITLKLRDVIENFSFMPAGLTPPVRPTVWIGSNNSYTLDEFGKRTGEVSFVTLRKAYANNYELVQPFELKPNAAGDPDYIAPFVDVSIAPGSTPYPNIAINRASSFTRNNCSVGSVGAAPTIVIEAAKYGGETPGAADVMAEAEYTSLNTQAYANTNGACNIIYYSAAISRASLYVKQGCTLPSTGGVWTITVAAGAYTSILSQEDANNQAIAYANALDTQANANTNGSCVAGQFYSLTPASGKANYRVFISSNLAPNTNGFQSKSPTQGLTRGINNNIVVTPPGTGIALLHDSQSQGSVAYKYEIYKNAQLLSSGSDTIPNSQGFQVFLNLPTCAAGDLMYVYLYP